jgi:Zn-dependent protease
VKLDSTQIQAREHVAEVGSILRLLATEPLTIAVGVVCAKATAFNLLPLATLAGGAVLREVVDAFRGAENDGDAAPGVAWPLVSVLFMLVWVAGRFAWGLVHALW